MINYTVEMGGVPGLGLSKVSTVPEIQSALNPEPENEILPIKDGQKEAAVSSHVSFHVLLFTINMFRIRKEIGSFSSPIAILDGKKRDLGEIENN